MAAGFRTAGDDVTIFSRSAPVLPVANHVLVDRQNHKAFEAAIGEGADIIVDTIAYDENDADQLLKFEKQVGMIVGISSASVYCDDKGRTLDEAAENGFPELPELVCEDQNIVPAGDQTYSTRKVAMEERLLTVSQATAAIVRPCAIYGMGTRHPREWWFVKRLLDGRRVIPLVQNGSNRFQTSAVQNIARLVVYLADRGVGGIFNAPDPDAPSVRQIGTTIAMRMGKDVEYVDANLLGGGLVGRTPWSVPRAFTISDAKALNIGYLPEGNYTDLVAPYIDWLAKMPTTDWEERFAGLAAYPFDLFNYNAEDTAMAAQGK